MFRDVCNKVCGIVDTLLRLKREGSIDHRLNAYKQGGTMIWRILQQATGPAIRILHQGTSMSRFFAHGGKEACYEVSRRKLLCICLHLIKQGGCFLAHTLNTLHAFLQGIAIELLVRDTRATT